MTASLVLVPVRFAATSYAIRVTLNSVTQTLTTPTLTVGRNYWMAGDSVADASTDGGVGDAIRLLEDTLDTHTQVGSGWSVSLSATNVVTIFHASTFQIQWGHASTTLDEALYGFTAANWPSSPGTTTTAPYRTKHAWAPGIAPSEDTREVQEHVASMTRALSGVQRTAHLASPKKRRALAWPLIQQALVREEYASSAGHTFETIYDERIAVGHRLRYYADATDRATWGLYKLAEHTDPMQRSSEVPTRWNIGPLSLIRGED